MFTQLLRWTHLTGFWVPTTLPILWYGAVPTKKEIYSIHVSKDNV